MKQVPWLRRINQFTGSNENLENQLLQTYKSSDKNNTQVMKDEENFITLAKRGAVFSYEIHINKNLYFTRGKLVDFHHQRIGISG